MRNIEFVNGHPIVFFYALVSHGLTDALVEAVQSWVFSLKLNHSWVVKPPEIVDTGKLSNETKLRRFGVVHRILSALPPWGDHLPKETDLAHLRETMLIVDGLIAISREHNCMFEIQLDATSVGTIRSGTCDRGVNVGLLEEWKKAHGI